MLSIQIRHFHIDAPPVTLDTKTSRTQGSSYFFIGSDPLFIEHKIGNTFPISKKFFALIERLFAACRKTQKSA